MSVPSGVGLLAELEGQAQRETRGTKYAYAFQLPSYKPISEEDWKELDRVSINTLGSSKDWIENIQKSLKECGFEIVKV